MISVSTKFGVPEFATQAKQPDTTSPELLVGLQAPIFINPRNLFTKQTRVFVQAQGYPELGTWSRPFSTPWAKACSAVPPGRLLVVKTVMGPFWARCTTHFRTYFSGWSGMFTGGTIWVLTHGHILKHPLFEQPPFLGPHPHLCSTKPRWNPQQPPLHKRGALHVRLHGWEDIPL